MIINLDNASEKNKIETVPSVTGSLIYNGKVQSPTFIGYNSDQLIIDGQTSATKAGTYTVSFTPTSKYKWLDGTDNAKFVTWTIAKAKGTSSISPSSGTIISKNKTVTFTVTRAGDGAISVKSNNTSIATASINGNTVTVTSKNYGSTTITVSVDEGSNYTAPNDKSYSVTVDYQYLHKNGSEYTSFTGILTTAGRFIDGTGDGSIKAPKVEKTGSSLKITQTAQSNGYTANGGWAYWANKIDLANYTTLRFSGTCSHSSWTGLGIWSSTSGSIYGSSTIATTTGSIIDVSGLNDSYYIGFFVYDAGEYVVCNSLRLE